MKIILALYLTLSTGYLFYEMIDLHNIISKSIWQFIGLTIVNFLLTAVMRDIIDGTNKNKGEK